jgi:hypothetical protein
MKKFLLILLLVGFGSVLEAKTITFEKCDGRLFGGPTVPSFDKNTYEKFNLVIDTEKKTITEIKILTDKALERYKNTPSAILEKITITEFNLDFFDQDYAKGSYKFIESNNYVSGERRIQINLRKKSYETSIYERNKNLTNPAYNFTAYCK